jgi:hypothetical protein
VGTGTAWQPCHLVIRVDHKLVAAMPLYERSDSYGEYIFDWSWAQAAQRSHVRYFPKLTSAIPFVPATGPRVLVAPGFDANLAREALSAAALELMHDKKASSVHVLFPRDHEAAHIASLPDLHYGRRASMQFHWRNDGYASFDAFLEQLTHDDRKQIKRERRRVVEAGVDIEVHNGVDVEPALWPEIFSLYTSISDRKWGRPYLTRAFFELMPKHRALVALARKGGRVVAMTLSFEKGAHIYGRHWGCSDDIPGLHFELCYYRLLERAIATKATLVEAGAQGEHKLKRGFLPVITHSLHAFADARFGAAVHRFLEDESAAVRAEQQELAAHGPFKEGTAPKRALVAGVDDL